MWSLASAALYCQFVFAPLSAFAPTALILSQHNGHVRRSCSVMIDMAINDSDNFFSIPENNTQETNLMPSENYITESSGKETASISPKTHSTGTSIGSQNVGEMLFNEALLKSGRGDMRVGSMKRWKDFRGNEIIQQIDSN